jgi:formylmethanofuran dehydrogenase subunit E
MKRLEDYIQAASKNGQPPQPGIILAIRMCLVALNRLEIADPNERKRSLITIVETDRCLPDAIQLVTGCRLANRTLKLRDMGKMAATFVDLPNNRAIRVAARESANGKSAIQYPSIDRLEALARAYRSFSDDELCHAEWVKVRLQPEDLPGSHFPRVICEQCGEGIGFHREVKIGGRTLCRACAGEGYYEPL